jgi:KaiC/GvpD/RAD55 family RecA-like ATPase
MDDKIRNPLKFSKISKEDIIPINIDQPANTEALDEYHIHLNRLDTMTNHLVGQAKEFVRKRDDAKVRAFISESRKEHGEHETHETHQHEHRNIADIRKPKSHEISTEPSIEVKRVKTGIHGLDELLEGGIPERSVVLLTGAAGTGKTLFALNFLIEGALNNEPGVYISLQESPQENINQMKLFGWPIDKLLKENKILMIQPELYNFEGLISVIEDSVEKIKAKRLVIDSASLIGLYFENPYKVRKSLLDLGDLFKRLDCTTIAIDEIKENENTLSAFGVEEFVADGVFVLYYMKRGNIYVRAFTIRKMRSTNHSQKVHPMEIRRPGGVVVYPFEEIFTETE